MSDKIAVLIDSDNAQPCKVALVLAEVAKYGTACVKRAYGDWTETNLSGWKIELLKNSIQPIQQFAYTRGKNSTDAALVIDAMDLLHSRHLNAFCLVSSDSDFTRLAARIRESGLTVYGCGERKTPQPFVVACDKFIYVENLVSHRHSNVQGEEERATQGAGASSGFDNIISSDEDKASEDPKDSNGVAASRSSGDPTTAGGFEGANSSRDAQSSRSTGEGDLQNVAYMLRAAVEASSDHGGWASLGEIGHLMMKRHPDFDARNYGYKKLTDLVIALEETFEICYRSPVEGKPVLPLKSQKNLSSQLESDSITTIPDNAAVADLPLATWRNKRYVLEESLSRKGSKGRKSWIKLHGLFVVELDASDSPLNAYWVCRLCDAKCQPVFFAASATTSAADHLRKVFEGSPVADSDPSTDESERAKRPRLHYSAVPKAKINIIREPSVGLIVNADLPFSVFTNPYFEQLVWQLDPQVAGQVPWSRQSMSRQLNDVYHAKKSVVRQELSHALTKIHLGFDLWTSPTRYAIMAVTAHFLDRQGSHQMRLLALRRQLGCHSGENLACTLLEVVKEWGVEGQVGVVVSDNAATNDTCLQNFYQNLDPGMKPTDVRARRMRCYGHVLNLVARAFLYGEDFEAFEAESQVLELLSRQEEDLRHWRSKGPVGKLHNIVRFIRSSPQRSELFKQVARENDEVQGFQLAFESTPELEVMMNNNTRWNSTYLMISRALVKQNDLRAFMVHPDVEGSLPQEDILSADDWRLLGEVKHILEPFYLQTMRTQGWGGGDGHGRLWESKKAWDRRLKAHKDAQVALGNAQLGLTSVKDIYLRSHCRRM
ncbi:NYN domain-containing protein [Cordyceps javanica]|nr:NYN domain-containing protein [Cordyceps javanica]